MSIGRTLPHSLEAEEYLISCCMIDAADVIPRCLEARISPDAFYDPKHAIVFGVLLKLYDEQRLIDISVLAEDLKTSKQLERVGGYTFLAQISGRIPTTAQAGYFIDKVREQALLRLLIRTATGAVEDCYAFSGGIDEFVGGIEQQLFAVTQHRVADRTTHSSQIVPGAMAVIQTMADRRGEMTGIRSGFHDLDQLTWGFQRSDLIILAARPSMGKTSLALNIADSIVAPPKNGKGAPVLIFSLEMSAQQLMQRMICSRARVNMKLLRDGLLGKNGVEQSRMLAAADELARAPLYIDDSSAIPVSFIRARARRLHSRTPLGAVIVDYLQLMSATTPSAPREQQVADASRGLKALAKELDVPVIVLSQLNRAADKEDRRPRLSDLRESGAIEQDADVVLMLARPKDADQSFQVATDTADLIVAKQRNGPVGDVKLTFLRNITRFENFAA